MTHQKQRGQVIRRWQLKIYGSFLNANRVEKIDGYERQDTQNKQAVNSDRKVCEREVNDE